MPRPMKHRGRLLATCLGDCVHVAGVRRFLALAGQAGYETRFLGAAQPVEHVVEAVRSWKPGLLALSFRLTPGSLERLLAALTQQLRPELDAGLRLAFGGTDPNCAVAEATGLFEATFGSSQGDAAVRQYLMGETSRQGRVALPDTLVERILAKAPYPLIRHHFGQPTVDETVAGAEQIADSGAIDVLSLGPDQNAQESWFHPEEMDPAQDGAGGVPLRTEEHLARIYAATRRGNHPLVRCYSGTRDIVRMGELLHRTVRNAWAAIPLFWYSVLDHRSKRPLQAAIAENLEGIRWHAERNIPVEVNDPHQWSLRSAPDAVAVAAFYLAAYNARRAGVRNYVAQMMFNTPAGTRADMDLGKMLAKLELAGELAGDRFRVWRETRTGLASMPADRDLAVGHLCGSVALQLAVRPHIVHVVGFSEADHAATASDLIQSSLIASGTIAALVEGLPEMGLDPKVAARRDELIGEARMLVAAIRELAPRGTEDPLADPQTLARSVECGLLDAPDLAGNPAAAGTVQTAFVDGACLAVDDNRRPLAEARRIAAALGRARETFS